MGNIVLISTIVSILVVVIVSIVLLLKHKHKFIESARFEDEQMVKVVYMCECGKTKTVVLDKYNLKS